MHKYVKVKQHVPEQPMGQERKQKIPLQKESGNTTNRNFKSSSKMKVYSYKRPHEEKREALWRHKSFLFSLLLVLKQVMR